MNDPIVNRIVEKLYGGDEPTECPQTMFPDGTHCGEHGWHASDCPARTSIEALLVRMEKRGGVTVKVDGQWHDVRLLMLRDGPEGQERPVVALSDVALLARAEDTR